MFEGALIAVVFLGVGIVIGIVIGIAAIRMTQNSDAEPPGKPTPTETVEPIKTTVTIDMGPMKDFFDNVFSPEKRKN